MRIFSAVSVFVLLLAAFAGAIVSAQEAEGASAAYYQSRTFNVPIIAGWEDQSAGGSAQFHLAAARATIRTATVPGSDAVSAAEADLAALTGLNAPPPIYRDKVNLADGTWQALVYDLDAASTASVMAREAGGSVVVISFVERDPAARTLMLTLAQADDSLDDAAPEIGDAVEALTDISFSDLAQAEGARLPSGEWAVYAGADVTAVGMVFGNDSYVALGEGVAGDLALLADAYNRTLLGFFITPDNSGYLALALAAVAVILGVLIGSLFWRERGIGKDLALLQALAAADE